MSAVEQCRRATCEEEIKRDVADILGRDLSVIFISAAREIKQPVLNQVTAICDAIGFN
jgi:hypothetical protein